MEPTTATGKFVVRPTFKRVMGLTSVLWLGCLVCFGIGCLYSRLRWSEQHDSLGQSILGVFVMATFAAAIPLVDAIVFRFRDYWITAADGVSVYVGKNLKRRIKWGEISRISVGPYGIFLRHGRDSRQHTERLYWTDPSDGRRLNELWQSHAVLPGKVLPQN